jgi:ribose 5-phosphate isomerase A
VARAALDELVPGTVVGVGTGSTVNHFIDALAEIKHTVLGRFPLPIEVIPMARERIARRLRALGGEPKLREGVVTDNGQWILDVHGLSITDPLALEAEINQWPGVVCCGIFGRHKASVCLLGTPTGVERLTY